MQEHARVHRDASSVSSKSDELDLLQIFGMLWREKWIILICAAIFVVLSAAYVFRIATPKYSATTTIALQVGGSQIVDIESVFSGVSSDYFSLNTEIEVIKSRKLGEQLVTELSLVRDPDFNPYVEGVPIPFYEPILKEWLGVTLGDDEPLTEADIFNETVENVMESIGARLLRDTYIFSVSVKTVDPDKSVVIANKLANLYIADQIAVKFEATENAVTWLSDRVTDLEVELKTKEDEIKNLRGQSNLVTPEALVLLNQQANDMDSRLKDLRAVATGAEARQETLRAMLSEGDPQQMIAEFSDPVLQRLLNDLPNGGSATRELFNQRFALLVQREQNDVDRAVAQASSLETSFVRLQQEIEEKTLDLVELQQAEREAEATRVLYETFLARLKETTVQRGLQEADARVLSPAINGYYVEPRKSMVLVMSLVLGSLIGIGIVLYRQFRHNGFRLAEDIEQFTGIAVMGQIPRMPIGRRDHLISFLLDKPASAAAEAIRNLRTSVLLSNIDSPPKVIMSTSSVPGEGKTTHAIALANNFAGLGKSVLLIEGDIRRRTFSQYFKKAPPHGLVSVLAGEVELKDAVLKDPSLKADILMGEKSNINAADLFSSTRFQEFMQFVRSEYDIVIIDTPPVLVVPDARVIGQSVDAIIYSVKWDRTARAQVEEGIRQFATAKLNITGFVLSQIDPKGMRRYGYGGKYGAYGAYARYGQHYYDS